MMRITKAKRLRLGARLEEEERNPELNTTLRTAAAMVATMIFAAAMAAGALAAPPPPPPPTPCQAALKASCGAALAGCEKYPCAACEMCIIGNQTALSKAGCSAGQETTYCSAPAPIPPPPPLSCTHTDSRGDSYDLSGVSKVDQLAKTIDGRPSWYHLGICGSPTQDPSDPTKGCLPPCQENPGSDCSGRGGAFGDSCSCKNDRAIDIGGEAVCQYDSIKSDPTKPVVQYNCGMLKSGEQVWGDGPEAGKGVTLKYEGGSMRGGCAPHNRSTTIVVECDPVRLRAAHSQARCLEYLPAVHRTILMTTHVCARVQSTVQPA